MNSSNKKTTVVFLSLLFLLLTVHIGLAQRTEVQGSRFLVQNGNILNIRNGQILSNYSIVVSNGIIESILPTKNVKSIDLYNVIDAKGSFLIPGLWDMHAHLRANNLPPQISTDWMMPLFIANGITGVRDMNSSCESTDKGPVCLDQMREWQIEIENGRLMGPRLLSLSSFQINPPWDYEMSEVQTKQMVQLFYKQNLDLIKTYFRLTPQAYSWIMEEANDLGIAVGGHIPIRISVSEASEKGLRSLEHCRDILFDCFSGSKSFRESATNQDPPINIMHTMVDEFDKNRCQDIFHVMIKNNTWYVPTHVTRRMEAFADNHEFRNDSRNQYIPNMLLGSWINDANRVVALDSTKYGRNAFIKFYKKGLEITGEAHKAGVRILVGTDGGDSFVYPGFSVHDELKELVKAGLTPFEALQAATLHAAEFLNLQESYGSIEEGKKADFILLKNNPLNNIEHTQEIEGLVFRGKYINRNNLNALLEQAKSLKIN